MPIGTVKWFDAKKGFGFLLDAEGHDVFVHYSIIEGEGYRRLWDGDQVEYEVTEGPKGKLASKVWLTTDGEGKNGRGNNGQGS